MATIFNEKVDIVPDYEVIRYVVSNPKLYTAWIGAGTSREATIATADEICKEIRDRLAEFAKPADKDKWAREELNWDDRERRYSTCLKKFGPEALRVRYFRQLIQGRPPVFSHHAVSLLMQFGYLKNTCLTTNFDKLVEIAFAQQSNSECQPIRSDEEARFWQPEKDQYYVIKLHGDYDTHNIRNTNDETIGIPKQLQEIGFSVMKRSGLIVIGSSGYENSVIRVFNEVIENNDSTILNMGLYWGVYVNGSRETSAETTEQRVIDAIKQQAVSRKIVEMMASMSTKRPNVRCAFFPLWGGAGNFFFELVQSTKSRAIIGEAVRFLDHQMRLRHIFTQGHLAPEAIQRRLERLDRKAQQSTRGWDLNAKAQVPVHIWKATGQNSKASLEVLYGDITSRSLMDSGNPMLRSAVVSPDDNFISASGGVALALLQKAGQHTLLNELAKFSTVEQGEVVVTSGGELPVNYLFHAAATRLRTDGSSEINAENIFAAMNSVFAKVLSLSIARVFVPLIGSGEGVKSEESLEAILRALKFLAQNHPAAEVQLSIVILEEGILARKDVGDSLKKVLQPEFKVEAIS